MMDAIRWQAKSHACGREAFRQRFHIRTPVIHRADITCRSNEEVQLAPRIRWHTSSRVVRSTSIRTVRLHDATRACTTAVAVVGCDGVHSVVRERLIATAIAYRGTSSTAPWCARRHAPRSALERLRRSGSDPTVIRPLPLRGGEQYNIVVTFHSRQREEWGVREGSREEVMSYSPRSRSRAPTAGQADVVEAMVDSRSRSCRALGRRPRDAPWRRAHPMLQYLRKAPCIALEDAVTLRAAIEPLAMTSPAFRLYDPTASCAAHASLRGARDGAPLSRESIERLVRNSLWASAPGALSTDALEWLYAGTAESVSRSGEPWR